MSDKPNDMVPWEGLSKPLVKILEMVQAGCGAVWEKHGIVRRAQGEARAAMLKATSNLAISEVQARATDRFLAREVERQLNIESIARQAHEELPPHVRAEERPLPESDWIAAFFNYAQDIGDSQMQQLWAKLLAGEIVRPRSFSRRTLSVVRDLGAQEANEFAALCHWRVAFWDPHVTYLVRTSRENKRTPSSDLDNLASVGLIYVDRDEFFMDTLGVALFAVGDVAYKALWNGAPEEQVRRLPLGIAQLTRSGEELSKLIPHAEGDELAAPIRSYWESHKWLVKINPR